MESLKSLPVIAATFNLMTGINPIILDIWNTFPSQSQRIFLFFFFFYILKLNPVCLSVCSWVSALHAELVLEDSRGLFLRYDGVDALTSMLRAGRGGLHTPLDILMRLAQHSCKWEDDSHYSRTWSWNQGGTTAAAIHRMENTLHFQI